MIGTPEYAERIRSSPGAIIPRPPAMFGMLCRALAQGLITPEGFRNIMEIKLKAEARERARGTDQDRA